MGNVYAEPYKKYMAVGPSLDITKNFLRKCGMPTTFAREVSGNFKGLRNVTIVLLDGVFPEDLRFAHSSVEILRLDSES